MLFPMMDLGFSSENVSSSESDSIISSDSEDEPSEGWGEQLADIDDFGNLLDNIDDFVDLPADIGNDNDQTEDNSYDPTLGISVEKPLLLR